MLQQNEPLKAQWRRAELGHKVAVVVAGQVLYWQATSSTTPYC